MSLQLTHVQSKPDDNHTTLMTQSAQLVATAWRERIQDQRCIAYSQEAIHQSRCTLVRADRALKNSIRILG